MSPLHPHRKIALGGTRCKTCGRSSGAFTHGGFDGCAITSKRRMAGITLTPRSPPEVVPTVRGARVNPQQDRKHPPSLRCPRCWGAFVSIRNGYLLLQTCQSAEGLRTNLQTLLCGHCRGHVDVKHVAPLKLELEDGSDVLRAEDGHHLHVV